MARPNVARGLWAAAATVAVGMTLALAGWVPTTGACRRLAPAEAAELLGGAGCALHRVDCDPCYIFTETTCSQYGTTDCDFVGDRCSDAGPNPNDAREGAIIHGYCTDNPQGEKEFPVPCEAKKKQVCIPSGDWLPPDKSRGGCVKCVCRKNPQNEWECKCVTWTYKVEATFSRLPCPDA